MNFLRTEHTENFVWKLICRKIAKKQKKKRKTEHTSHIHNHAKRSGHLKRSVWENKQNEEGEQTKDTLQNFANPNTNEISQKGGATEHYWEAWKSLQKIQQNISKPKRVKVEKKKKKKR